MKNRWSVIVDGTIPVIVARNENLTMKASFIKCFKPKQVIITFLGDLQKRQKKFRTNFWKSCINSRQNQEKECFFHNR